MDHQTSERVNLYARRQYPGDPLLILIDLVEVNNNDTPMDGEIRSAASQLKNGCTSGTVLEDASRGTPVKMTPQEIIGICLSS